MRSLIILMAALVSLPALALDDKYKPSTKTDPIYNEQTKAAAAEVARRKAEADRKAAEPLVKVPVGKDTSIQPAMVGGQPGVVVKKELK